MCQTLNVTPCGNMKIFGNRSAQTKDSFIISKEYVDSGAAETPQGGPSYDFGMIVLPQSFGDDFGFFALSTTTTLGELEGMDIVVAGFPSGRSARKSVVRKWEDFIWRFYPTPLSSKCD